MIHRECLGERKGTVMAFADRIELDELQRQLFDEMAKMRIIDAHEHLWPEKERLAKTFDWAWLLQGYLVGDLASAGLSRSVDPLDNNLTARQKWEKIKPYWNAVKWGTYARGLRLSLKEWFGVDDITDENFEEIGRKLNENNRPGFYREALGKKCNIERVIVCQQSWKGFEDDLLRVIVFLPKLNTHADLEYYEKFIGRPMRTPKQVLAALEKFVADAVEAGVVGFKTSAAPMGAYDRAGAQRLLVRVIRGESLTAAERPTMNRFLHEIALRIIHRTGKPVAVHCGVWGDFRELDVMNFFETMQRFGEMHFDLFHMGVPSVREMAFVGKNLPNVSLNLCWCPLVSQHMMENGLQEYIDIVPTSKFIAFGGDYHWNPELTWGHLQMCRESLARVFAARIRRGMIDFDGSVAVLKAWLYDNPKRIYGI